jgi:hypothetical protein
MTTQESRPLDRLATQLRPPRIRTDLSAPAAPLEPKGTHRVHYLASDIDSLVA